MEKFQIGVAEKLGFYVYRLIDPRDGLTFYVGKGQGNRVFDHIKGEVAVDSDALDDKIQRIRDIKNTGLEVLHIIHRHGLDEDTAFEIEGALIDAYAGLDNIQNGAGNSENGIMHVHEINQKYAAQPAILQHDKIMFITINNAIKEGRCTYSAVRSAWRVSIKRAEQAEIICAVLHGMIKEVYINAQWQSAEMIGRFEFIADIAPEDIRQIYVGKLLPESYQRKKGEQTPFKYTYE